MFDADGFFVHAGAAGGSNHDNGRAVALHSSGKILVAGNSHNGSNADLAVWRLTASGTLDTIFDSDGFFIHNNAAGGSGSDQGNAILIDSSNGKIVVAGSSIGTGLDLAVWRLQ